MTGDLREQIRAAANGYDAPDLVDEVLAAVQRRAAAAVKTCASCGVEHPVSAFGPHPRTPDGLASSCRAADAARRRAARAAQS